MKYGIVSDSHKVEDENLLRVTDDLIGRGAEMFIHAGDLDLKHKELRFFGGLPVACALTRDQHPAINPDFVTAPAGWHFTMPAMLEPSRSVISDEVTRQALEKLGLIPEDASIRQRLSYNNIANRVVIWGKTKIYLGHERSHDVLADRALFLDFLKDIDQVSDGVTLICTGHTHFAFLVQSGRKTWINPGAVMVLPESIMPGDAHSYALYDSSNGEVVFCRIPVVKYDLDPITVGVIADTDNVATLDTGYWAKLAREFHDRGTSVIIMCGNHWGGDIGRPEFSGFDVHYNILPHQQSLPGSVPSNWHRINPDFPIVEINGFKLLVDYDFGMGLSEQEEYGSLTMAAEMSKKYRNHHVDFLLCGQSQDALYEEGDSIAILCPGNSRNRRKFATICLPRREVTFGAVRIVA